MSRWCLHISIAFFPSPQGLALTVFAVEQAAAAAAEQEVRLEEAVTLLAQAHEGLLQKDLRLEAASEGTTSQVLQTPSLCTRPGSARGGE